MATASDEQRATPTSVTASDTSSAARKGVKPGPSVSFACRSHLRVSVEEHRLSGCLVDACAADLECLVNDAIERVVDAYKFPRHP
jgi:hypothetical protein